MVVVAAPVRAADPGWPETLLRFCRKKPLGAAGGFIMARELREAGYDPASAGIEAVVVAEPARIVFQRDLNGNGVIDPTHERVTYLLRPGESTLRRDAGGGAQPIAEGVRRFALTYFDARGAPTSAPAQIASIRIELETGRPVPQSIMASQVMLRNAPIW